MSPLEDHHHTVLVDILRAEFVPHLPPLLRNVNPVDDARKNLSRAFSAFAIHKITKAPQSVSAESVIDDFGDEGIDAIYLDSTTQTLFLVQSKFKRNESVMREDSLEFCQGIRKLLTLNLDDFNANLQKRRIAIEDALGNCNHIQLVLCHIGSGVNQQANNVMDDLFKDTQIGEERLENSYYNYDATCVIRDLQAAQAYEPVKATMNLHNWSLVAEPRATYFGIVNLIDLVKLHEEEDKALYSRNIRTFLGQKTDVNVAIQRTLREKPSEFLYLNNGVTALCQEIIPKGNYAGKKRLNINGFSVINGAQTIASSAKFVADNPASDITSAKVSITLITADEDGEFGKSVTRARNHQNPVLQAHFVALDDEQERLRRDIANVGYHYVYKAEAADGAFDASRIRVDEAANALAMIQSDPRFAIWIKREPARLLDTESVQYQQLFDPSVTAFQLVNAVLLNRYIQGRLISEIASNRGQEKLAYKHGNHVIAWILAKRVRDEIRNSAILNPQRLNARLSSAFDLLRQAHVDETEAVTSMRYIGPLALFRNQTNTIPFMEAVMIDFYNLESDTVVAHKRRQQRSGEGYPEALFGYLVSKAPQIGDLA